MQNAGSEKKVLVDGEELGEGQEKKLKVGAKIKFGEDSEWQVRPALCASLAMHLELYNNFLHMYEKSLVPSLTLQVLRNVKTHA